MKYTLICFTFNKKEAKNTITGEYLTLRNNWVDENIDENDLPDILESLGFNKPFYLPFSNKFMKMSGDFTVANTRIIVHIIKN